MKKDKKALRKKLLDSYADGGCSDSEKYQDGGKKPFTRPEGWEKTIKRSFFDSGKDYTGESYEDIRKKKEEESGAKKQQDTLEAISSYFKRKNKK